MRFLLRSLTRTKLSSSESWTPFAKTSESISTRFSFVLWSKWTRNPVPSAKMSKRPFWRSNSVLEQDQKMSPDLETVTELKSLHSLPFILSFGDTSCS